MLRPILACRDPYRAVEEFVRAGWSLDFSQPPESGDPLAGVSLLGNRLLLGVTEGYVPRESLPWLGCGVELYLTVPAGELRRVHEAHRALGPTEPAVQPWGDLAFEVVIGGYRFMIAGEKEN